MRTWVTKGIAKFSKKKQRLHVKHLKKHTFENEKIQENYASFFESIKKKSEKLLHLSFL